MSGPLADSHRFSYSIVWAPIPMLTWLLPFVGHLGVCSSTGVIYDFQGPYSVGMDDFLFGHPTRYWRVEAAAAMFHGANICSDGQRPEAYQAHAMPAHARPSACVQNWDMHLANTISTYQGLSYNIMTRNCHALVVDFLNSIAYQGSNKWNMVKLVMLLFFKGRYTNLWAFICTWLPSTTIVVLGAYFGRLLFLVAYLGITAPLCIWFLLYTYMISRRKSCQCSLRGMPTATGSPA